MLALPLLLGIALYLGAWLVSDEVYAEASRHFSEEQLASLISRAKENNPHQSVLIRGDGDSSLKFAVRVMGLCNKAGMDYRIAALQEM